MSEETKKKAAPKPKADPKPKVKAPAVKLLYRKVGSTVSVWRTEEAIKASGEDWELVE